MEMYSPHPRFDPCFAQEHERPPPSHVSSPGRYTAAMLLSDAVVRGNGWGRGKKGNGGNMKERPSSFPYLTQKIQEKQLFIPNVSSLFYSFANATK